MNEPKFYLYPIIHPYIRMVYLYKLTITFNKTTLYNNALFSDTTAIHGFYVYWIFHVAMPFGNYCIPLKHKFLRLQGQDYHWV